MPEIAEVETVCRQLNDVVRKQRLLRIEVLDPLLQQSGSKRSKQRAGSFETLLSKDKPADAADRKGTEIIAVERQGKAILFRFNGGLAALLHLRMTGRLLYTPADDKSAPSDKGGQKTGPSLLKYVRMVWHLSGGRLLLIDPRRFATLVIDRGKCFETPFNDPLAGVPADRLEEMARGRRLPVKSFLMDQSLVAGIGNIYACEILFAAGIDPRRAAGGLTNKEWQTVSAKAVRIIKRAVEGRGTTLSDWRDLYGSPGRNQHKLAVYGRHGEPCRRCGGTIERIVQNGRGTWFCPACQH
jgi:formamidopyrimidine-DNA glycosylase